MSAVEVIGGDLVVPDNPLLAEDEYDAGHDVAVVLDFRRLLKQIDARLDIIWVKAGARVFPKGERWYIVRHNEGVAPSYWMVEDEHGGFCVPDLRHLERLQEYDTAAHRDVWRKFTQRRLDKQLRHDKRMDDKSEEFRTRLGERLAFEFDAQVAVTSGMKDALAGKTVKKAPPLPPSKQRRRKHKQR
jgi:hypothetical protein